MTNRPTVIVVANSVRALAASAIRAGFRTLAIDVFGDSDTREMCPSAIKLEGGLKSGLTLDKVASAVKDSVAAYDPIGLVYGSGFEHQPETIAAISRITRIIGNGAETLERAKDPLGLARLCAKVGVSHPPIAFEPPKEPDHWLVKRRGGAGGAHISAVTPGAPASANCYFQRRVTGRNISALFVANGKTAEMIGLSVQWTSPTPDSPFRYGGAAGPVDIGDADAGKIARSISRVTSELGLVGLNSADFLVSSDAAWLIEINPRPGATLDVFETEDGELFAHHVAACEGRSSTAPSNLAFKAAEVVYAPRDLMWLGGGTWPDWTADRPAPGTRIAAGDPLCTILASGATVDLARSCAAKRAQEILAFAEGPTP